MLSPVSYQSNGTADQNGAVRMGEEMAILLAMLFGGIVGAVATGLHNIHSFEKGKKEGYDFGYRVGVAVGYFKGQKSMEKKEA